MLHAKTATIDGRWTRVGSSNLNPSSLLANWEIDLFIEDAGLARAMEKQFADDLHLSGEVVSKPRSLPPVPVLGRPTALVVENRPGRHHRPRGIRERRKQAVVRAAALIRAARAALMVTASGVFFGFALLLVLLPRTVAYTTAAFAAVIAVFFLMGSIHRRRHG